MAPVRRAAVALAAVALAGCAAVVRTDDPRLADVLSGRLAVRIDAAAGNAGPRALSAGFELRGNADAGRLDLATPLGSVMAQARWEPGAVVLVTPQGQTRFTDLDALTREVLGESLPVVALFDWLRGRPWPGADSTASVPPADAGFEQLGWVVNVAHPGSDWLVARRDQPPAVTVRAKLDR